MNPTHKKEKENPCNEWWRYISSRQPHSKPRELIQIRADGEGSWGRWNWYNTECVQTCPEIYTTRGKFRDDLIKNVQTKQVRERERERKGGGKEGEL